MTLKEAKQILGLESGPLTRTRLEERYKALREANNEEGSLYIGLKVNTAKKTLEQHLQEQPNTGNYRRR